MRCYWQLIVADGEGNIFFSDAVMDKFPMFHKQSPTYAYESNHN